MNRQVPVLVRRDVVREARFGDGRTDEAIFKTLKRNHVISDGVRGSNRGRRGGSLILYCILNRDAVRAFRVKDLALAVRYAKAAARIEQLSAMRRLVRDIRLENREWTARSLADALSAPDVADSVRAVQLAVQQTREELPAPSPVISWAAHVVALTSAESAVIELDESGARLPIMRSTLADADLDQAGTALAASLESIGEGRMVMSVEPLIADGEEEDPIEFTELDGSRWGSLLTADNARFAAEMLADPNSHGDVRAPRTKVRVSE